MLFSSVNVVHIPRTVVLGAYMTQKLYASRERGQRESNMKTCFRVNRIKMLG